MVVSSNLTRPTNHMTVNHSGGLDVQGSMKRPTAASLKKVTPENLARLGAERLAELLVVAAENRPELKRRLRMELAADQGAEHLLVEIDRRLDLIGGSRSRVSWRQRHAFVRDLEALRALIAGRLAELDPPAAADRALRFLGLGRRVYARVRDKEGRVAAVFERAAADAGRLIAESPEFETGPALAAAMHAGACRTTPRSQRPPRCSRTRWRCR